MPQLDLLTYPSQLFWLAVTFVVLYLLMRYLAMPRVGGAIEARRQRLDDDLARAAAMKSEAEAVVAAHQKTLAAARAEAQRILKETADRHAAGAAERSQTVARSLAAEIEEAARRIAAEKQAALAEIHGVAANLAGGIAEKLAGVPVDPQAPVAAVDRIMVEHPL
jgi:F-type H+-transporting ATPase subunit b